jgi:hypothetical protein
MSALLVILNLVSVIAVFVARAVLMDEVKGRVQRRISARLEATIAELPAELRAEWAQEWRAELATIIAMPVSAARFVRSMRHAPRGLVGEPAPADVPQTIGVAAASDGQTPVFPNDLSGDDLPDDLRRALRRARVEHYVGAFLRCVPRHPTISMGLELRAVKRLEQQERAIRQAAAQRIRMRAAGRSVPTSKGSSAGVSARIAL